MDKYQEWVKDFHYKYGITVNEKPTIPDEKTRKLRMILIEEEFKEFIEATQSGNIVQIADAIVDLMYIAYGSAVSYGIDVEPIFHEVHRSNMTKEGNMREDGKVLKGNGWKPPNVESLLRQQMSE